MSQPAPCEGAAAAAPGIDIAKLSPEVRAQLAMQAPAQAPVHLERQDVAAEPSANRPPRVDIKDTARAALDAAESICRHWLPEGKRQGPEWIARNPTRHDETPGSFAVNVTTGKWSDFATGDKGGDLVSLVAYLEGLSQGEAAGQLAAWLGVAPPAPAARPNWMTTEPTPSPPQAKRQPKVMATRPARHPKLGNPSRSWEYRDATGAVLCVVLRFETAQGKEFRPLTRTPEGWIWRAPEEPRPLYGLDRLAARPEAEVILAEGEKAADAAGALLPELVPVASMNGSKSPKKSDWAPLQGRRVRIWPDHDDPGTQYARTAAALAYGAGATSVVILDLSALADALPKGWDAADALADGWTPERLAERARWVVAPSPFADSRGTEGTRGTASNDAGSSGSPSDSAQGTEGTTRTKPAVDRPGFSVQAGWTGYGKPGTYWHGLKDEEEVNQWVCSPLWADAMAHGERDADYGLLLRFRNASGREREWTMPMAMLRGSDEELRGELLNLGVRIDPISHRLLNAYLMSRYPERRILAATCTGWHSEGAVFVLPNRIIGTGDVRYQSEQADHDEFIQAGTFEGWRSEIAARCAGNPMLQHSVSAALAGPLLARLHRTGCGFHFVGDSSTGKSTALSVGASCWGGPGFIRTWRATGNGLEGIAAALNDTALILDEISEADPREIGSIIYAIGNGTGKSRAARSGKAREVRRWRVVLLSSGERTLAATMAEGGKRTKAGQEARLLDIPCTRAHGVFDDLHGLADGRAFSDALRTSANRHYGHAGPAFVERLIADARDHGEYLARLIALKEFKADNGLEGRAAGAFALAALAGELAIEWGILPWSEGEALDAATIAYQGWRQARGKGQTETRQILEAVADFIAKHGDARFSPLRPTEDEEEHAPVVRDRAGWWKEAADNHGRAYLFSSAGLREATEGFDLRRVLDALDQAGWIDEHDEGKRSKKFKAQGRPQSLYAIAPAEVES
ncbi:DUF927 domain-containing protein [Imhoffiella purpurea]|uniref:DNA primase, phage-associated n=1 Tax=Imhoffiella purpurea TaxID=1249627 RepID=W9V675_9GAMM|nr:DUF927 domain-containing protein [Imhoffiella purpurea]EXJ14864.1 DNA primase, phage-associated [Imhoffiella purpurea]